jgi:hypothetical protein
MGNQRKLTALLHELQHARSPLAQARVLARAWRTLRELSPTDRRLLARHVGFDGAEEMLEGLSRRKGGLAPAMLLRVLANARTTDDSEVSDLLSAFRDPSRLDEGVSRSADLASELLAEPSVPEPPEEVEEALGELQAVEKAIIETPEETLAALNEIEPDSEAAVGEDPDSADSEEVGMDLEAEPQTKAEPEPEPPSPPQPPPEPVVDWSRWDAATPSSRPAPKPRPDLAPPVSEMASRPFEARKVLRALGAERTVLSQLRVLRRERAAFSGSSAETLRDLIESFPDGWARRRAVCALIEAGVPSEVRDAIDLVALLGREADRRWCLGVLARRGGLVGQELDSALDLVSSPVSMRRLRAAARQA